VLRLVFKNSSIFQCKHSSLSILLAFEITDDFEPSKPGLESRVDAFQHVLPLSSTLSPTSCPFRASHFNVYIVSPSVASWSSTSNFPMFIDLRQHDSTRTIPSLCVVGQLIQDPAMSIEHNMTEAKMLSLLIHVV